MCNYLYGQSRVNVFLKQNVKIKFFHHKCILKHNR